MRRAWAIVALVLSTFVTVAACGSNAGQDDSAPGYRPGGRAIDRSPFSLAQPTTTDGPTTLPPLTSATSTSSTASPPPTTVPLPTDPGLPNPDNIRSICGFERTIESFHGLNFESAAEAQVLLTALPAVLDAYRRVGPVAARADLAALRGELEGLRDVLAANGWDRSSPAAARAVDDLAAGPLPNEINRTVLIEKSVCP